MSRRTRHQEEPQESHERWLVSYADFITLLFAFFVVMYAISSVSEGKYRVLSNSLVAAFRNVTVNASGQTIVTQAIAPPLPRKASPKRNAKAEEQMRQARERMQRMADEILAALGSLVQEGQVRVSEGPRGISVEISASVLFPPGDVRLESSAQGALRAVAHVLAPTDYPVTIEGHTDTAPINNAQYASNWDLSVLRATTVVRLFIDAGVAAARLTATGYGEQRPIASNDTPEGRARNRRVTITIEAPMPDAGNQLPLPPASMDTGVTRP